MCIVFFFFPLYLGLFLQYRYPKADILGQRVYILLKCWSFGLTVAPGCSANWHNSGNPQECALVSFLVFGAFDFFIPIVLLFFLTLGSVGLVAQLSTPQDPMPTWVPGVLFAGLPGTRILAACALSTLVQGYTLHAAGLAGLTTGHFPAGDRIFSCCLFFRAITSTAVL